MPWVPRRGTRHCGEKATLWSRFATHHARHLQLSFSLKAKKSWEAQSHLTSLKRGSKKTNKRGGTLWTMKTGKLPDWIHYHPKRWAFHCTFTIPFTQNKAHFIFLQKRNPRLQPGQKSEGVKKKKKRQKRFHFNLTLTVSTEKTPTPNTNGNEPTWVRQKGTLGCGFFFRAGGNHFRGDGERGGSAVFRRQLSLGGPREAPEAGGPGRDGGSGVRGRRRSGPREAVPAGAAELLHLQPALRAARGRGKWSGAARGRPWVAEGPG